MEDVQRDAGDGVALLRVRRGKGGKERDVPIGRYARDAISAYLTRVRPQIATARSHSALFLNLRGGRLTRQGCTGIVQQHAAGAGIHKRVSPHTFRHSCAVHLLEAGVEVNVIRGWLGHADLSTTNRYAEINTKTKQDALRTVEPPGTSAEPRTKPVWRSDESLLNWLASL